MKKINHIFVPFTAYLLIGLMLDSSMYFAVWGVVAAVLIGVKECLDNKVVTIGISVYAVLVVLWFGWIADASYRIHAVLAVTGLLGILFLSRLYRYRAARVLTGYLVMLILLCLELMEYSYSNVVIALAVFLFLNSVSETVALLERYRTDNFLFLYAIIAVITVFTPAPKEPYDWGFVVRAVQAANNMAERIVIEMQYWWGQGKSNGIFEYGYTGYSDSSSLLTAGIRNREAKQLTLDGKRTKRNLYLKGKNSDSFTGERWEATLEEPTMDYRIDTLETLYALFEYTQDIEELHRFAEIYQHKLTLSYIRTQSQFYPLKLLGTTLPDMQYIGDNPISDQIQGKGYSYICQFVDIDYASAEMETILGNSKDISYREDIYELIYTKMQEYYGIKLEKIPYDDFLEQIERGEERIRNCYGIVDSTVSGRVKELAKEITKDCRNDYEKCRALERYLYQYSYNQDIALPVDVNVLDWFLFDGRQGFCVHYATALAEMLRCVGIPSRVAEGFLVDYSDSIMINQYPISSSSAHAWVEAYIEGFGWMRLEPTAINASNANMVWYAAVSEETQEDFMSEEEVRDQKAFESEMEETAQEVSDMQKETAFWSMLAVLFAGLAAMLLLIFLALWFYRKHILHKSSDPDVIFLHLLQLLEKKFLPREKNETVREYFARLSETEQMSEKIKTDLSMFAEWMERYWYAGVLPNDNEIQSMKEIRNQFL